MTTLLKRARAKTGQLRAMQDRDREGFARQPQTPEELSWLESDPVWPEEEAAESIPQNLPDR